MSNTKNKKNNLSYNSVRVKKQKIGDKGLSALNISGYFSMLFSGALIVLLMVSLITVVSTPVAKKAKATGRHFTVHIVAGQSNAAGYGTTTTSNYTPSPYDEQVSFYYSSDKVVGSSGGEFVPLGPQSIAQNDGSRITGFGPELNLGRSLVASGVQNVAIIKVSKNGTSLGNDWNPNKCCKMYAQLKNTVNAALNKITTNGDTYSIDGFHWMQGEADVLNNTYAQNYRKNLNSFISKVRKDLSAPQMPFIIGRIKATWVLGPNRDKVRAAQVYAGKNWNYVRWFNTDTAQLKADKLHYNNNGIYQVGNSFASKILPFLKAKYPYLVPSATFNDVFSTDQYSSAVNWSSSYGVMAGYVDNTFRPNDQVSRADMAEIMWKMAGSPNPTVAHNYSDVPLDASYRKAVQWAKEKGIMSGWNDNTFRPTQNINRQNLALYLNRLSGVKAPTKTYSYLDMPTSTTYRTSINWATQFAVIPKTSDYFRPNDPALRHEAVSALYELAKRETAWKNRMTASSKVLF